MKRPQKIISLALYRKNKKQQTDQPDEQAEEKLEPPFAQDPRLSPQQQAELLAMAAASERHLLASEDEVASFYAGDLMNAALQATPGGKVENYLAVCWLASLTAILAKDGADEREGFFESKPFREAWGLAWTAVRKAEVKSVLSLHAGAFLSDSVADWADEDPDAAYASCRAQLKRVSKKPDDEDPKLPNAPLGVALFCMGTALGLMAEVAPEQAVQKGVALLKEAAKFPSVQEDWAENWIESARQGWADGATNIAVLMAKAAQETGLPLSTRQRAMRFLHETVKGSAKKKQGGPGTKRLLPFDPSPR